MKSTALPPIQQWQKFAGGTGAAEGIYSYAFDSSHGEYHVFPAHSRFGRHLGYDLRFAATKFQPVIDGTRRSGLWHELGRFKTPASAVKAARDFDRLAFVGV